MGSVMFTTKHCALLYVSHIHPTVWSKIYFININPLGVTNSSQMSFIVLFHFYQIFYFVISEQFIGATIVLLTLSAMTAIFIVNFHFKGQGIRRPGRFIRNFVLNWLARIVFMKRHVIRDTADILRVRLVLQTSMKCFVPLNLLYMAIIIDYRFTNLKSTMSFLRVIEFEAINHFSFL